VEGWLGLVMFGAVMALIFTGYPVAFSLAGVTLLFAGIGVWVGDFSFVFLGALPQRVYGVMQNFTLLAVPFFIFMGLLLERARLAEDLLHTAGLLFGSMRGGLAIAVIAVGTLLAATTGVVGATVVAMGLISLPVMLRYNYNQSLATGVIATSGTLGQIVPPSIILIVLGDQLGVSVGQLFMAALLPGVMLAVFYVIYVAVLAWARPEMAPALPPEELGVVRGWAMAPGDRCHDTAAGADRGGAGLDLRGHRHADRGGIDRRAGRAPACRRQSTPVDAGSAREPLSDGAADQHGDVHPRGRDRLRARVPRARR